MAMKFRSPLAAPTQPSPTARALASLSTNVGRPVSSARRRRRGNSRHAGMFSGETVSPPGAIGPPLPAPTTTSSPRSVADTRPARTAHMSSADPSRGGGRGPPVGQPADGVDPGDRQLGAADVDREGRPGGGLQVSLGHGDGPYRGPRSRLRPRMP